MIWYFTYKHERDQERFMLQLFWLLRNLPSLLFGRSWIRLFHTLLRAGLSQWGLIYRTPPTGIAFLPVQLYWVQWTFAWFFTMRGSAASSFVASPFSPKLLWCSWQQDLTWMITLLLWSVHCKLSQICIIISSDMHAVRASLSSLLVFTTVSSSE